MRIAKKIYGSRGRGRRQFELRRIWRIGGWDCGEVRGQTSRPRRARLGIEGIGFGSAGTSRAECDGSGDEWRVGGVIISRERGVEVKMEVIGQVEVNA